VRIFRPSAGNNISRLTRLIGAVIFNGSSAPTAWLYGGKGLGVPTRTSAGLFVSVLQSAPPGVLVSATVTSTVDAIANAMVGYSLGLSSTAGVYSWTYTTAVPTSAVTAADPPAASGTSRYFHLELIFCETDNF
jgi:hypothetical protein